MCEGLGRYYYNFRKEAFAGNYSSSWGCKKELGETNLFQTCLLYRKTKPVPYIGKIFNALGFSLRFAAF